MTIIQIKVLELFVNFVSLQNVQANEMRDCKQGIQMHGQCSMLMVIAIKKPKGNCPQEICMLYTFEHIALPSFPAIWVYGTIFQ